MRLRTIVTGLLTGLLLTGCASQGTLPEDPYEPMNRKIHQFNMAFDATFLKPPAKLYKTVIPSPVRAGVNNAFNNVYMLPTIANDLLQAEWKQASNDTSRFLINTTLGIAGIFDVATRFQFTPHANDLGVTFAKWGDKKSPYLVLPFLGPSTIRDAMGILFDYTLFTPYPYLNSNDLFYSLVLLRYIDLRSQMLDTDRIINEAFDKYAFIRDAYLQNRAFMISGQTEASEKQALTEGESLYVDE